MRQVPHYLIAGSGRLARHLKHYFTLQGLSFDSWSRNTPNSLINWQTCTARASHILLAVSDPAIEVLASEIQDRQHKICVHFSGRLSTPLAESAHPLMTFAETLYDLSVYQNIPFVLETNRRSFQEILPGLTNPHFVIEAKDKIRYHAWCVMSGNFTVLLWQGFAKFLKNELGLPPEVAWPYLNAVAQNIQNQWTTALTGPLARGDQNTQAQHLQVLPEIEGDLYRVFQKLHAQMQAEENLK